MTRRSEPPIRPIKTSHRPIGLFLLLGASWLLLGIVVFRDQKAERALAPEGVASSAPVLGTMPTTTPSTQPVFSQSADVTEGKAGVWGQMQYAPIVLEMPESYGTVAQLIALHDRWNFAFRTRDDAIAMMTASGVTTAQLSMIPTGAWQTAEHSVSLAPPDAFVLALSAEARAKLYPQLMDDPANETSIDPIWFRVGRVDFRLRGSGISDESIALLKGLLYLGPDDTLLFNDEKAAVRSIADPAEQSRFLKAIERKRSLQARLILTPTSDTAALTKYWGKNGREENLLPLLDAVKYNAMAGIENPGRINILSLLPPFAQSRLYRHAESGQAAGNPEDCFWTAFNFFSEVPDSRIHEQGHLVDLVNRDYVKVDEPGELGDVILLADAKGNLVHAANYVADNIVFTKNGLNSGAPWILVPMRDLLDTYRIKYEPLTIAYYRKRATTAE